MAPESWPGAGRGAPPSAGPDRYGPAWAAQVEELTRRFGPDSSLDPMLPLLGTLTAYRDRIDARWAAAFACLDLDSLIAARRASRGA